MTVELKPYRVACTLLVICRKWCTVSDWYNTGLLLHQISSNKNMYIYG